MKSAETRKRIIKSARECFDRYGEKRVSLEEISSHAGVHIQTVYRLLKNRENLRKEVMLQCLAEMGAAISSAIKNSETLEQAIVQGTVVTLDFCSHDKALSDLLHSDWQLAMQQLYEYKEVGELYDLIWKPVFKRAQKTGEFSSNWTYADFSRWLRGIQYIIFLRQEMSRPAQLKLLRHYMHSGFIKSPVKSK